MKKAKKRRPEKYTIVQHSGYGYAGKIDFQRGLELRAVHLRKQKDKIVQVGGLLFDNYRDAFDFIHRAMYPDGYNSLVPQAPGNFIKRKIDGLCLWVPDDINRKKAIEMGARCRDTNGHEVNGDEEAETEAQ